MGKTELHDANNPLPQKKKKNLLQNNALNPTSDAASPPSNAAFAHHERHNRVLRRLPPARRLLLLQQSAHDVCDFSFLRRRDGRETLEDFVVQHFALARGQRRWCSCEERFEQRGEIVGRGGVGAC